MEPIEEKINLESEEVIPFSSSLGTTKVHAFQFETSHVESHADISNTWIYTRIWIRPLRSIYTVLFKRQINMLLPFGPLAILLHYLTRKHVWVYFCSSVGITPLSVLLSYTTEQLGFYTGPTVGALLNAIFCNATALITSIYALKNGRMRVVQQLLLGSILSNMLLVLGCAFFTGGIIYNKKVQVFNKANAKVKSGLLLMAAMGILFPSLLHFTHTEIHFGKSELSLSRFSSFVMIVAYASYVNFQLRSQQIFHNSIDEERVNDEEDSGEEDAPEITHWEAIGWLCISIMWVCILSGYLVDAIEGASESLNIPEAFITIILLPIAENASAIKFAIKDKLDNTIEVAIGSSTHILLFVIPLCVLLGWFLGKPMDLNFQLFETFTLFITVVIVTFLLQDGTSTYYKGVMLILCYLIISASVSVHIDG